MGHLYQRKWRMLHKHDTSSIMFNPLIINVRVSVRCPVLLRTSASTCLMVLSTGPLWCSVSAGLLCLGVWEPSGGQQPWQFCRSDQTHPRSDFHSTKPKQTGGRRRLLDWVSTGLFSDSLHYNTFQNMPTALPSLPKPFKLLFAFVTIPQKCIYNDR